MDKQMIEEMAEYIFGNAITHDTQFKEDCRSIARDLICVGYRKIPEGAVVLTGVRFEDNEGKTLFTDEDWKFSEQLTPITVTSKEPLAEEDYESAKILCMKHCEFLPECQEQTRKETAEKFAKMLKEKLEERKKICLERWKRYEKEGETDLACYWNGKENEIYCVKADIYEICKEIIGDDKNDK